MEVDADVHRPGCVARRDLPFGGEPAHEPIDRLQVGHRRVLVEQHRGLEAPPRREVLVGVLQPQAGRRRIVDRGLRRGWQVGIELEEDGRAAPGEPVAEPEAHAIGRERECGDRDVVDALAGGVEVPHHADVAGVVDVRDVDVGELEHAQRHRTLGGEVAALDLLVEHQVGQVLVAAEAGVVVFEEEDAERVGAIDAQPGHVGVGLARPHQHVLVGDGEVHAGVDEVAEHPVPLRRPAGTLLGARAAIDDLAAPVEDQAAGAPLRLAGGGHAGRRRRLGQVGHRGRHIVGRGGSERVPGRPRRRGLGQWRGGLCQRGRGQAQRGAQRQGDREAGHLCSSCGSGGIRRGYEVASPGAVASSVLEDRCPTGDRINWC